MYYTGTGIAADYTEAGKWTRLAAEQGYAPAQTDLAYLYEQGKGMPLDYVNAYVWYRAASATGDKRAAAKLKELKHRMTPRQIGIATNRAEEMQQRAWRPELNGPLAGAAESAPRRQH
jgi:TPR repeat protein